MLSTLRKSEREATRKKLPDVRASAIPSKPIFQLAGNRGLKTAFVLRDGSTAPSFGSSSLRALVLTTPGLGPFPLPFRASARC